MNPARPDWVHAGAATLCVAGASPLFSRFRNRKSEKAERRRRERLNRIGRLAQCEILDIVEEEASPGIASSGRSILPISRGSSPAWRVLISYRYTVSGVSYETAQDVAASSAVEWPPTPGQTASVKYDPANPSNSILVAWSAPETGRGASKAAAPETGK